MATAANFVTVYTKHWNTDFSFGDGNGKEYGTEAYRCMENKKDIHTKAYDYDTETYNEVFIPWHAISMMFPWRGDPDGGE